MDKFKVTSFFLFFFCWVEHLFPGTYACMQTLLMSQALTKEHRVVI